MEQMSFTEELITGILGDISVARYFVLLFFIIIGVSISIRIKAFKRDRQSDNTPIKFNLWFFIIDNLPKVLESIAIAFLFIRFGEELTGTRMSEWGAVLLGSAFDLLIDVFKKKIYNYRNKLKEFLKDKESRDE